MTNQDFAHSLLSVAGLGDRAALAVSHGVHVSVPALPSGAEESACIELSIADLNFRVVMEGLDMAYDRRPLTINQMAIDDPTAKGVACMLIEAFLYDYRAYQPTAMTA